MKWLRKAAKFVKENWQLAWELWEERRRLRAIRRREELGDL
jgi:hypothetical protein